MCVVPVSEFVQRLPECFIVVVSEPESLLLQGTKKAFDDPIPFRTSHKAWQRFHAQKAQLGLEIMADIRTAMVMPDEDPVRHLGLVHTEYTLARLPNRLQRFMAGAVLSHMNPETLSGKVVEDGNDDHLPLLLHPRCRGIGPPFVRVAG